MTRPSEKKEFPVSMRLPESDIAIIDRAARLRGRSRTDFVRDAAMRAAEDALMDRAPIRMNAEDFAAFMVTVTAPASPVPEMVEILRRPAAWDAGDRDSQDI